jgi:hypothetical protein
MWLWPPVSCATEVLASEASAVEAPAVEGLGCGAPSVGLLASAAVLPVVLVVSTI